MCFVSLCWAQLYGGRSFAEYNAARDSAIIANVRKSRIAALDREHINKTKMRCAVHAPCTHTRARAYPLESASLRCAN